jgi:translation elongation factor EF-G
MTPTEYLEENNNELKLKLEKNLLRNKVTKEMMDFAKEYHTQQLILSGVVKSLPSKDAEFIYSLLPEWTKEAPKGLDPTMYGTLTYEGDKEIVDKLKEILK